MSEPRVVLEEMVQGDPDYSARLHAEMVVTLKRVRAGVYLSQMMRQAVADGLRAYRGEGRQALHRGVAAYSGGKLVGAMSVYAYLEVGEVEIKYLADSGEADGVGRALLDEAMAEGVRRGMGLAVRVAADAPAGFWEKLGWARPAGGEDYWVLSAQELRNKAVPGLLG